MKREDRQRMKQFQVLSMHLSNKNELLLTEHIMTQKVFTQPKGKDFLSTVTNST